MTYPASLAVLAFSVALSGASIQSTSAQSRTGDVPLSAERHVEDLAHPWGLDFLPDGSAIITEREGRMRLVSSDGALSGPLEGVPQVYAQGQGGLLDVAVSPSFESDSTIFFTFSEPGDGGAGTAVARARLERDGNGGRLEDLEVIFSMDRKTQAGQHFGSRIAFHSDGTIFFTIGDRGDPARAQDVRDHAGSVLRINRDGTVPDDNPGSTGADWLPEIWSIGHRNPQGAVWDPVTQAIWVHEHGPRGGDEVNRPQAGLNYGWPEVSQGVNYDGTPVGEGQREAEGVEQPIYYWDPSPAPSGFVVYEGEMFLEWQGEFLIGALAGQSLIRLERDDAGEVTGEEERYFQDELGRIRDVNVAPDGSLWLLTDEPDGAIIRISRGD